MSKHTHLCWNLTIFAEGSKLSFNKLLQHTDALSSAGWKNLGTTQSAFSPAAMIPFAIPRQHTLTCQSSQLATIVTACRLCSSDQKQNHKFTQHPKPIPPSCLLDRVHSWSANRSNKVFTYFCCWRFGPTALCLLPSDSSVYLHFPFTTRGAQVALLKPAGFFLGG